MASELVQLQRDFTRDVVKLLGWLHRRGYGVRLGDAYRDPRAFGMLGDRKAYGHPYSNHKRRLALDLVLDDPETGEYMDRTDQYQAAGDYWESLDPLNVWGGRFNDGNHFSKRWGNNA